MALDLSLKYTAKSCLRRLCSENEEIPSKRVKMSELFVQGGYSTLVLLDRPSRRPPKFLHLIP